MLADDEVRVAAALWVSLALALRGVESGADLPFNIFALVALLDVVALFDDDDDNVDEVGAAEVLLASLLGKLALRGLGRGTDLAFVAFAPVALLGVAGFMALGFFAIRGALALALPLALGLVAS